MAEFDDSTIARFWSKVDKDGPVQPHRPGIDQCWVWLGSLRKGYGYIRVFGVNYRAHRLSWLLSGSSIPEGLCVLHRCDNPSCVRPEHLWVGTQLENIADRHRKGREACGDRHGFALHPEACARGSRVGSARVTEEMVVEIRRRARQGERHKTLAHQFGITKLTVSMITRRKTWIHVP